MIANAFFAIVALVILTGVACAISLAFTAWKNQPSRRFFQPILINTAAGPRLAWDTTFTEAESAAVDVYNSYLDLGFSCRAALYWVREEGHQVHAYLEAYMLGDDRFRKLTERIKVSNTALSTYNEA